MRILLTGPIDTKILRALTGFALEGAPPGQGSAPVPDLAAGLLRAGHSVEIVTLDGTIDETITICEDDFRISYVPLRSEPRFRARVRSKDLFAFEIQGLVDQIAQSTADIVHAHWTYEYAEAAIRSKTPHLVTMHDLGWDYFWIMKDLYRFIRLVMKYRAMMRVKHLTTVAPFMTKRAKEYGYFRKAIAIPNGLLLPEISAGIDATKYHASPVFATIGNAGNIKNVSASLLAFEHIRAARPDATLHLFGPGLDDDFVGRAPGVVGHSNVDHPKLMNFLRDEATVLIHPSRMEACPVIIAEAKARGVPVVAGERSGGVSYVCGEDAGCFLVDIENPSAIASAALDVLKSAEQYKEFSRKARRDVEVRFDSDHVTELYVGSYNAVLSGNW